MNDEHVGLGLVDLNAERAQRVDRVHAIFAGKKTVQRADAVGESRDDGGAMRNAFVARNSDLRFDAGRSLYAEFHGVNLISFAEAERACDQPRAASDISSACPATRRAKNARQSRRPQQRRQLYGTRKILPV